VIRLPFGDGSRQPALDVVFKRELALTHELENDRGHERLRDAADAEAVARPHQGLRFQVSITAREPNRPPAFTDEEHRTRDARCNNPIEAALKLRFTGRSLACGTHRRDESYGRERERRTPACHPPRRKRLLREARTHLTVTLLGICSAFKRNVRLVCGSSIDCEGTAAHPSSGFDERRDEPGRVCSADAGGCE
jgi:hypothetical protein